MDMIDFPRMSYDQAMKLYGCDKPDLRFGMTFVELTGLMKGKGFKVADEAGLIAGIKADGCAEYTRKQLDELTDYVKRPQVGASGLMYIRYASDGSMKSSVDKFYSADDLAAILKEVGAVPVSYTHLTLPTTERV